MKKKLIHHLLTEEKIYDKFMKEMEKIAKKREILERKKSRSERKRRKTGGSESKTNNRSYYKKKRSTLPSKISIPGRNFFFGFFSTCSIFLLFALLFMAAQYFCYLLLYSRANQTSNLMKLFILGDATYCTFYAAGAAWYETIIFNNTVPGWRGKTTLEMYEDFGRTIDTMIIPNYTRALSYDLGNYTKEFRESMTKVSQIKRILWKRETKRLVLFLFLFGIKATSFSCCFC